MGRGAGGIKPELVGTFPNWMKLFGRCFGGKAFLDFKHHVTKNKHKKVMLSCTILEKVCMRVFILTLMQIENKMSFVEPLWLNIKLEEKFRGVLAEVSYNTHQWSSGEQAESHNVAADNSRYKRAPFGRGSVCL